MNIKRVGIGKKRPACGEPVNVRRFDLRVTAQRADPVVQIINRDEKINWRLRG